ncbi:MAG: O-antigen ligase family protein, partial [Actinomycetota bacterium]|nr:O-antigen ligase family protein [Actinomycetota bacterium]
WTRRLLLLAAGSLAGTGLALSLSRAIWIGAVVGLALTLLLLPRLTRRRAAPVVAAGVVAIGAVGYLLAGSAVQGRLASILNPTNTQGQSAAQQGVAKGDQNRVSYWTIAVDDAFLRHPIAGIGVGNMPRFLIDHESLKQAGLGDARALANSAAIVGTENASSTYFQLLGEAGIFGAVLLLLLFRGLFRDLRAGLRAYPVLGAGLAGAVVALLICWVTDYTIENQPVAASMAILLGAVAAAGRYGSRTGA